VTANSGRTIERIAHLPVLLVATFRPEFVPPWSGLPQVTALTLARLDRRAGAAMVEGIARNAALSSEAAVDIVERSDGIPLFVEELTRAVLEAGGSNAGVEKTLARAVSPSAAVPAALHAPLMARLDRLGQPAKEIAQIAAVTGREFSWELLASVAQRREAELQEALSRLAEAGLVLSRGTPPHANYLFKHALVRDAAYGSLLRRRREELHSRAAAVLEADFAERIAAEPELLAHHLTEAGLFERAVGYWQRAGERAAERSADREAIAHLKRGLEILGRLPESSRRDEQELFLQAALIGPATANEGYASVELGRAARRAVKLGRRIGADSPAQLQAVWARAWLAGVHFGRLELRAGLALAEEALALAEHLADPHLLTRLYVAAGQNRFYLGHLAGARRDFEEGLALYDPKRDRAKGARYGFDTCAACHAMLGQVVWDQGFPDQALRHAEEGIAAARGVSHPLSEAWALFAAALVRKLRGEVVLCLKQAEALLDFATEQVLPYYAACAKVLGGWALVKNGRAEEGFAQLRAGLDACPAIWQWRILFLPVFAEASLQADRTEEGISAVHEMLTEVEATESGYFEAQLYRLEGELQLSSEQPDESGAEDSFRNAIAIARGQGARSFELRGATSLARLLTRQGRRDEAHALLAPVYGWFTEGFDTKDLKEAKALLEELGDTPAVQPVASAS
jgi:predicted ATPase